MKGVGTYGLKSIVGPSDSWYSPDDEPDLDTMSEEAWQAWVDEYESEPDENSREWIEFLDHWIATASDDGRY